jgi:hypothetical protein
MGLAKEGRNNAKGRTKTWFLLSSSEEIRDIRDTVFFVPLWLTEGFDSTYS